jgi:hypothetical protein
MDLKEFKIRYFKPRDTVHEYTEELVLQELKKILLDGAAQVVITDQGKSFLISVTGKSKSKVFNSESYYIKENIWGWPRDWQIGAVYQVLADFIRQIEAHFQNIKSLNKRDFDD